MPHINNTRSFFSKPVGFMSEIPGMARDRLFPGLTPGLPFTFDTAGGALAGVWESPLLDPEAEAAGSDSGGHKSLVSPTAAVSPVRRKNMWKADQGTGGVIGQAVFWIMVHIMRNPPSCD